MSGLEVVGVIASIIQIADLGAKLSVKLCTFYKTVKVINKSIQELSSDVSLTCSILNELGKTLEQDDQTKLCSKQAFSTAQEVLQQCKSVFEEIDTAIEKHSQENEKGRLVRQARKITIAFLGPDLDVLKSNLERLKSTTLLMLHVIMYAGQLRRTNMKSTMANQRGLIQTLLEEKIANDAKFNNLRQSIQAVSMPKDDNSFQPSITALSIDPQPTPLWNEVGEYYNLVRGLLCQIDAYQDILEQSRHLRIRNGVINVHSAESVLFQHIHGQAANQLFDDPIFRFRDASFPTSPQFSQSSHAKDETAKLGESPMNPVQPSPYGAHQSSLCLPPTTYPPPPPQLGNGVLHHNPYGPSPQESPYYTTHSPYTSNPASARYASGGPPDLMASAAQMQRPYPPIYHTPQSSSPASVASQPHKQHGRNMYSQSPQMPPQMFGYPPHSPINPVQPSSYGAHQSSQQHPLTTQPLVMPPQKAPSQAPPHQSPHLPTSGMSSSPIMKLDSSQHPTTPQQTMLNPPLTAPNSHSMPASNPHANLPLGGTTSSAAPGPIPATTPLAVRQDSNSVQWVAFQYSRDQVEMEYTIRCDVESVIVDTLTQEFKTENCVYPRAYCSKDQYRGNRLVYETECNAVGWALAELNPALRGKRGLIQRAVDSWRNSTQDPRLRSRRVRRMAKINRRQSVPAQSAHMAQQGRSCTRTNESLSADEVNELEWLHKLQCREESVCRAESIESKEENWDHSPRLDDDGIKSDLSGGSDQTRLENSSQQPAPDAAQGSSSYVSNDKALDLTLESLVLQWTTLKPEELQVE